MIFVRFQNVTFAYPSSIDPLFSSLSLHLSCGWSGIVGPNGAGKTTLLKLVIGQLKPDGGVVERPSRAIYCPQRTDEPPEAFDALLADQAGPAWTIRLKLGLEADWISRWHTLSHGERKRAQIATALWQEPDVLAIDEPTNHLDGPARDVLADALQSFRGVGVLVSHDRMLLDTLCRQCVFLDPPDVAVRPGGVTEGMQSAAVERETAQRQHEKTRSEYKRIQREAIRRSQLAAQAQRRRSKRGLAIKDHDAREKKDRARISGKDGVGGRLRRQLAGKLEHARNQSESSTVKKEYATGIWLPAARSRRNALVELPTGSISLGQRRSLNHPDLIIRPTDRIALTGANGSGKSTLVRKLISALDVPPEHRTYIPQEIAADRSREMLDRARRLGKGPLGHLMTIVSRLGSRPERLLASDIPSPGETRKLMLALGMLAAPHVIVMDEPTNHMDLPSIAALEAALAECPCCLLLVSHDLLFLKALTQIEWQIVPDQKDVQSFVLDIH